ncbi:MAG: deoxyribonuclease IV [Candidatus Micrarchaeaceae archaeon]
MIRLGYHISIAGSIDLAFDRALFIGCNTMQIFVNNPRSWSIGALESYKKNNFIKKSETFDIKPVIAHISYLCNIASPNPINYKKSIASLQSTIERCSELNIPYLVLHLGSHLGKGKKEGIKKAVNAINTSNHNSRVMLLLENEAGQRNSIGSSLDDLVEVYDGIKNKNKGLCFDTCHAFAAGYDIKEISVLDEINSKLNFKNIRVIHLNDAKYGLGSHRDRHINIGHGFIGFNGFKTLFNFKDLLSKPLITEVPELNDNEIADVRKFLESLI